MVGFFRSPYEDTAKSSQHIEGFIRNSGVHWYTNLDIKKRHEDLPIFKKYSHENYPKYDNYDAIEVSKTAEIPEDYFGVMGVPITFLDKFNPEQFEILGTSDNGAVDDEYKLPHFKKHNEPYINGKKFIQDFLFVGGEKILSKKYKDGLFRDYFSDKSRLLDLCNALLQTDGKNPDEIIVNTLDGVFFGNLKNDLSCVYKNNFLILLEHQSTPNENMPLRMLFYVAELLKQYIEPFKEKIYQLNQIELPTPKFYLFYNGRKNEPEQREMKLSTAFKNVSGLELVVNFYNLNEGNNENFLNESESLKSYCIFVNRVEKNLREGMILERAIQEAIDYCINADIMAEYLKIRRKEVVSMLGFEYDEDLARKAIADEAMQIGIETGREEKAVEMVKNLLTTNLSIEEIGRVVGWSKEKILKFLEKN